METQYLVVAILIFFLFLGLLVYVFLTLRRPSKQSDNNLEEQLFRLQQTLDQRLGDNQKMLHDQFQASQVGMNKNLDSTLTVARDSTKKIEELTKKMTQLEETNKQILSIGDQLRGIEDILKNPKQRWVLGEYFLETLLANIFQPGQFCMQYSFPSGEIVDAVLFVGDKILPIDSKFSLENYNKVIESNEDKEQEAAATTFASDIKKRITETAKYIRPQDGTMDFAFMFLPSEGMYYDLLVNRVGTLSVNTQDLIEFAFKKRVIIVSPTSLYAYLQTVLQGLNSLKIEQHAQQIRKQVEDLGRHLRAYETHLGKLGNTLQTSMNHYDRAQGEWRKIDKDVLKISSSEGDLPEKAS